MEIVYNKYHNDVNYQDEKGHTYWVCELEGDYYSFYKLHKYAKSLSSEVMYEMIELLRINIATQK